VYPVSFCKCAHNSFPLNNIEHAALDMQTQLDGLHIKCLLKLSNVNKGFNGKTIFHSQVVSCIQLGIRNKSNISKFSGKPEFFVYRGFIANSEIIILLLLNILPF